MVRAQVAPTWTWVCDNCGFRHPTMAYNQGGMTKETTMRRNGWFISRGTPVRDLCPVCYEEEDG